MNHLYFVSSLLVLSPLPNERLAKSPVVDPLQGLFLLLFSALQEIEKLGLLYPTYPTVFNIKA